MKNFFFNLIIQTVQIKVKFCVDNHIIILAGEKTKKIILTELIG